MPAKRTTRADAYLADLERVYGAEGSPEAATKRLASWLGNADQTVLLFAILMELRAMRESSTRAKTDEASR